MHRKNNGCDSVLQLSCKKGATAFNAYYSEAFGERWGSLKEALLFPTSPVEFGEKLLKPYYMDVASIVVASSMPPLDEGEYLDMCAAPGGKMLVLASMMGKEAKIQANELSSNRRARLRRVIEEHLSEDVRNRIEVTGYDGSVMAKFCRDRYERILLDAPCSSERHVLNSPSALKIWSPARIKTLSIRQWALLSSAFLMLKQGGFLVYSTCALLDAENDLLIDKLLSKYEDAEIVKIEEDRTGINSLPKICNAEKTRHGIAYLPDRSFGAGPMYFSVIKKKSC